MAKDCFRREVSALQYHRTQASRTRFNGNRRNTATISTSRSGDPIVRTSADQVGREGGRTLAKDYSQPVNEYSLVNPLPSTNYPRAFLDTQVEKLPSNHNILQDRCAAGVFPARWTHGSCGTGKIPGFERINPLNLRPLSGEKTQISRKSGQRSVSVVPYRVCCNPNFVIKTLSLLKSSFFCHFHRCYPGLSSRFCLRSLTCPPQKYIFV